MLILTICGLIFGVIRWITTPFVELAELFKKTKNKELSEYEKMRRKEDNNEQKITD